jgi:MFS family permease
MIIGIATTKTGAIRPDRAHFMASSMDLLNKRRFLPLFVTQLLGAFNDNLYKNAVVLFFVYTIYNDPKAEGWISALATALFIIPFFLLSALSGQLADMRDKAHIIRLVKLCEIFIMLAGGAGLLMAWQGLMMPIASVLMMGGILAMGVHSTFFGPIKYAILPQHLHQDEVLGGTGLVEAGTYIAILAGTVLAGFVAVEWAALLCVLTAGLGYWTGRQVPPAPAMGTPEPLDFHIIRSSIKLVKMTMRVRRLFLAIIAISFFWTIGAVLIIQFPPLAKNVLTAGKDVASLFLGIFSIGVAIGSIIINRLLNGTVSARFAPASVIAMGVSVVMFYLICRTWVGAENGVLYGISDFIHHDAAWMLTGALLAIAITGGMFVVPLYAFLTTTVDKSETARTVAANNIVNSGAMVIGSLIAMGLSAINIAVVDQLLLSAVMCLIAAWLAQQLHKACD